MVQYFTSKLVGCLGVPSGRPNEIPALKLTFHILNTLPSLRPRPPLPPLPVYLQHVTCLGRTLTQYTFPNNQRKQLLHYAALATETQRQRETEIHAKGHTETHVHAHVRARQQKQPFNRMLLLTAAGVVKL